MRGDREIQIKTYIAVMVMLFLWGFNGNVLAETGGGLDQLMTYKRL